MRKQKIVNKQRWRRGNRVRNHLQAISERPRLSVFRSSSHVYCQLIDDNEGKTLVSVSTRDKDIRDKVKHGGNCEAAKLVGTLIAERAKAAGITQVKFDRGRYKYHGRVAELATAAREAGLEF
ncbi:MAG: 50S ribosomal protein L18 [Pirellulaceae bacterium]|nr:50S ribosomal protein L18 [Pirellulaceae bacterium]